MPEQYDVSKMSYVAYVKITDGKEVVYMFIKEFDDVEDAEVFKARGNQKIRGVVILIGITNFHGHKTDERRDMLIVNPKNEDDHFFYHEMIELSETYKNLIGGNNDESK